ncbi:ankyrin repeat domain-containing protein [Dyella psychrodurans]|nr:ankyrin repeat domain-containing protein [Dyella psychrodurans]
MTVAAPRAQQATTNHEAVDALFEAARYRRASAVESLIALGTDVNACDSYGALPWVEAALGGQVKILRLFIDAGADVNAWRSGKGEQTALMISIQRGYHGMAQMLIEAGADLNARDAEGRTALSLAKAEGNTRWNDIVALIERTILADVATRTTSAPPTRRAM